MCASYILSEARTSFQRGPVVQTLGQKAERVALLTRHRGSTCDRSVGDICYLHWVNTRIAPKVSLLAIYWLLSALQDLKKKKKKKEAEEEEEESEPKTFEDQAYY